MAEQNQKQPAKSFDPFAAPSLSDSKAWMWATGMQALFTAGLLLISFYAEGHTWENQARAIMVLGIIATWGLALRTIRERLVELIRYWHKASTGLLRKASQSGKHLISVPLSASQEKYIKGSIWRLRIIAAGITLPFFVMPILWSMIAVAFSIKIGPAHLKDYWAGVSMFMLLSALIVAGYLHWAILPAPAPVRVSGQVRRMFQRRR
jgi:hypothetical protein